MQACSRSSIGYRGAGGVGRLTIELEGKFEEALAHADYMGLRKALDGTTEAQRKSLAKVAIAHYRDAHSHGNDVRTALNAVLVTASESQLDKLPYYVIGPGQLDFELLEKYGSESLQRWVERRISQGRMSISLVNDLVMRGLCNPPDTDEYVMQMMGSLPWYGAGHPQAWNFRDDLLFLNHYVWRFFEVEGNGQNSLAARDKYSAPDSTWEYLLLQCAEEGILPRSRLLDASLDALDRGFLQFRSLWYSKFHEALKPTIDERLERLPAYLNLVGSSIPTTVAFALSALAVVDKQHPLSADLIAANLEPALSAKSKASVNLALSLIESTMRHESPSRSLLCILAARGLLHESPEIQGRIIKLISKYSSKDDQALRRELGDYQDCVSPSIREKLSALMEHAESEELVTRPPQLAEQYVEKETAPFNPLLTAKRLDPIASIDDLIATCSGILERPLDAVRADCAVAAIVRFSARLPEDFEIRSAPLKIRSLSIANSNSESLSFLQRLFAAFIHCWLTRNTNLECRLRREVPNERFIYRRFSGVLARIIEGNCLPVLSAPTHEPGWIEPPALIERWQKWNDARQTPDEDEQAVALLRLPLAHLDELFPQHVALEGEFWQAVRFALGDPEIKPQNASPLWFAAQYFRSPVQPAVLFSLGGDALFAQQSELDFVRYLSACFPAVRNQFVASGIRRIGGAIDSFYQFDRCVRAYIEVMLDPAFVFDLDAFHALAAGLIVADPECSGVARDVLIQLIDSNRLNVEQLGKEIGVFLYCGRSKGKRLVKALSDVSRISGKHSSAVRQLLERAMQGGPVTPRELSAVLEFLNELLHAEGAKLTNRATIKHLQSLPAGGRSKQLIGNLLSGGVEDLRR